MKRFSGLLLVLHLAACGKPVAPYSGKPLISAAENAVAPALRPGLWLKVDPDCVVDSAKPRGAWPACATAVIVRQNEMLWVYSADVVMRERFRLADGLPMILQTQETPSDPPVEWRYSGLRAMIDGGQIVEYASWPILCSPIEPATEESQQTGETAPPRAVAKGSLPLDANGRCLVHSRDELRSIIIASEGWTADREHLKWVRSAEQ